MQGVQQSGDMSTVTHALRGTDIVHDHLANFLLTILAHQETLGQPGGGDLRDMLMLGNGEHFLLG
jgi:hypothetical protein